MGDIQLTLTHDAVAFTAREVCRSALKSWELPDRVDDVLLVVTELVHNVRRHTDDGGHLRLSVHEDAILVEVTDSDPRPPHLKPLDPGKPGGRGLLLVSAVARRWGNRPTMWAGPPRQDGLGGTRPNSARLNPHAAGKRSGPAAVSTRDPGRSAWALASCDKVGVCQHGAANCDRCLRASLGRLAERQGMHPFDTTDPVPEGSSPGWMTGQRLQYRSDWFTIADVVGDELVPAVADWCTVHVRAGVVESLRTGLAESLAELGLTRPVEGEPLEMVTLRHKDAEREPVIRQWAAEMPVRTGDVYGAGRVTATGITRYLPHVGPALVHAAITDPQQVAQFQRLGIASSIVVPLCTPSGAMLGAMTLLRELDTRPAFTEADVQAAERFALSVAEALDASRAMTVNAEPSAPDAGHQRTATWQPTHAHDVNTSTEGRNWARRTLPEILTREPRRDLYEDMDLVFTELLSNAVRHGGGLREAQLADTGEHLRLVAADNDPRSPARRTRRVDRPNGRGMHLIEAIADRWGVYRHHAETGKRVWVDLLVQ